MAALGQTHRRVGLLGATGVGVGAIVGGGIMVLAGVAFQNAGPSALLAFALNGVLAFITAMSFAEISSRFPQSGGAYTFATKVLSVRAAFAVGWILWFAYIVAGVLYAVGFAAFAVEAAGQIISQLTDAAPPDWMLSRRTLMALALGATALYGLSLIRKNSGGGQFATVGKLAVFVVLIAVGIVALMRQPLGETTAALSPFFSGGVSGLVVTMGYTFIALQGFDLIAAIAGEVKEPGRNIPRAMFLSLGCALAVYLPLLFILSAVGSEPGEGIAELAAREGDTVFAAVVSRYMGATGYWLVILAAILSTLSALQANMLAASRVALSMAHDRTLPAVLGETDRKRNTPIMAVYATGLAMVAVLFAIPDVGAAGAAAGLIFLIAFALAHVTSYLARARSPAPSHGYRTPLFPLVPIVGAVACAALAIFQAIMVPSAASIVLIWLGLGMLLYIALLRRGAEASDASAEGLDPGLVKLRGKSPLVLLPVANPAQARGLIGVANALAPTGVARVLLLTVVNVDAKKGDGAASSERLRNAQEVVREALTASYAQGNAPEALITTAAEPWGEIARVAEEHGCAALVLGLRHLPHEASALEQDVEDLINKLHCDVAIMRAPPDWRLESARKILVPVGGRGAEHGLRARVLGSICRIQDCEVTFFSVIPRNSPMQAAEDRRRDIRAVVNVGLPSQPTIEVVRSDDAVAALLEESRSHELVIVGLTNVGWGRKVLGAFSLAIARQAPCAALILSSARSRTYSEVFDPLRRVVAKRPAT